MWSAGDGREPELGSFARCEGQRPLVLSGGLPLGQELEGTPQEAGPVSGGRGVFSTTLRGRSSPRLQGEDRLLHPSEDQHPVAASRRRVTRPAEGVSPRPLGEAGTEQCPVGLSGGRVCDRHL